MVGDVASHHLPDRSAAEALELIALLGAGTGQDRVDRREDGDGADGDQVLVKFDQVVQGCRFARLPQKREYVGVVDEKAPPSFRHC